jgi:hypothetical protein
MIIKCNSIAQEEAILEYIGKNYGKCLYLYLDLKKYTIKSANIQVYQQVCNGKITTIFLLYYTCLHVFSENEDFDSEEIKQFLFGKQLSMIYCTQSTALKLLNNVYNDTNNISFKTGWVAQIQFVDMANEDSDITLANKNDFNQIAQMIYADDDIGRSYNFDDLVKQLSERAEQGFSRNYVIKDKNIVIAHACTNAEFDNIAVVGELLVRKEYRRRGYASNIYKHLCNMLLKEGKKVYSFFFTNISRQFHQKMGFSEICEWSKIVINGK